MAASSLKEDITDDEYDKFGIKSYHAYSILDISQVGSERWYFRCNYSHFDAQHSLTRSPYGLLV